MRYDERKLGAAADSPSVSDDGWCVAWSLERAELQTDTDVSNVELQLHDDVANQLARLIIVAMRVRGHR